MHRMEPLSFERQLHDFINQCQAFVGHCELGDVKSPLGEFARLLALAPASDTPAVGCVVNSVLAGLLETLRKRESWSTDRPSADASSFVSTSYCGSRDLRLVERLNEVLFSRHADSELTMSAAAATLGVSRFQLARVLKRVTGKGFCSHRATIRVAHATWLLSSTALSIKEIAAAAGFSGTCELDRQFRATYSVPPSVFRDRQVMLARRPCAPPNAG